jgi:hypothetical protein
MNKNHQAENRLAQHQQLSAVLAQMSEDEMVRLLNIIEALQADLVQLIPLFSGQEPVEAVTHTLDLLIILTDEMKPVFPVRQAKRVQGQLQNPDNEGASVDYAPLHRLLSTVYGDKRRLVWADA